MNPKRLNLLFALCLCVVSSAGCSQPAQELRNIIAASFMGDKLPDHQQHLTFLNPSEHIASGTTSILAPPDRIHIYSPQASEVNATQTIRADGTIRLPLLGPVRVAGLTPREAAAKLQIELRTFYENPYVEVSLANNQSKVFYIFGEIGGGGAGGGGGGQDRGGRVVPITGRDHILNVLTLNAPSQNAWLSQIKVIRPDAKDPKKNQEIKIDFYNMITNGDLRQNILLQEGDIVYVPPTPMAWIGYRIREILQPVSPVINAYQTPASILDADDVYKNNDSANTNTGLLSNLRLP